MKRRIATGTRTRSPRETARLQERLGAQKALLGGAVLSATAVLAVSVVIRPLFKDFKLKSE